MSYIGGIFNVEYSIQWKEINIIREKRYEIKDKKVQTHLDEELGLLSARINSVSSNNLRTGACGEGVISELKVGVRISSSLDGREDMCFFWYSIVSENNEIKMNLGYIIWSSLQCKGRSY